MVLSTMTNGLSTASPYSVVLVPLVSFGSHGEGDAAAELEALVEPNLGDSIAQYREKVVRHLHLVGGSLDVSEQAEEVLCF